MCIRDSCTLGEALGRASGRRGQQRLDLHLIIERQNAGHDRRLAGARPTDVYKRQGLSEAEIRAEMKPESYIGRCPEQVAAFTAKCRGLCTDAAKARADITL